VLLDNFPCKRVACFHLKLSIVNKRFLSLFSFCILLKYIKIQHIFLLFCHIWQVEYITYVYIFSISDKRFNIEVKKPSDCLDVSAIHCNVITSTQYIHYNFFYKCVQKHIYVETVNKIANIRLLRVWFLMCEGNIIKMLLKLQNNIWSVNSSAFMSYTLLTRRVYRHTYYCAKASDGIKMTFENMEIKLLKSPSLQYHV
jgi:hypothetical protein